MKKGSKRGIEFVTPPPADLFALTDPGSETVMEKLKSFASGVKYTFVLSLMLWWLPILGQCIAGYVGGRRAGSAYRGFMAAMVPVLIFLGVSYAFLGDPTSLRNPAATTLEGFSISFSELLPFIVPYMSFSALYMGDFMNAIQQATNLQIGIYTVVIVFAFIGGLMADQNKREMGAVFKAVVPIHINEQRNVWSNKSSSPSFDSMKPVKAVTKKPGSNSSRGKKPAATRSKKTTTSK